VEGGTLGLVSEFRRFVALLCCPMIVTLPENEGGWRQMAVGNTGGGPLNSSATTLRKSERKPTAKPAQTNLEEVSALEQRRDRLRELDVSCWWLASRQFPSRRSCGNGDENRVRTSGLRV
jgi:hypothetical protein